MTRLRTLGLSAAVVALVAANPALAGPGDAGLVVEKLADPDPGFVPPPPEKRPARAQRRSAEKSALDEAFENLGRVTGQVAQMAEQRARADRQRMMEMAEQRAKADIDRARQAVCNSVESVRSAGIDVSRWDKDCK